MSDVGVASNSSGNTYYFSGGGLGSTFSDDSNGNTSATISGGGLGSTFSDDSNGNTSATISGGGLGVFFCTFCGIACDMVDDGDFSGGPSLIISSSRD